VLWWSEHVVISSVKVKTVAKNNRPAKQMIVIELSPIGRDLLSSLSLWKSGELSYCEEGEERRKMVDVRLARQIPWANEGGRGASTRENACD
jgi:hypothetical protein